MRFHWSFSSFANLDRNFHNMLITELTLNWVMQLWNNLNNLQTISYKKKKKKDSSQCSSQKCEQTKETGRQTGTAFNGEVSVQIYFKTNTWLNGFEKKLTNFSAGLPAHPLYRRIHFLSLRLLSDSIKLGCARVLQVLWWEKMGICMKPSQN